MTDGNSKLTAKATIADTSAHTADANPAFMLHVPRPPVTAIVRKKRKRFTKNLNENGGQKMDLVAEIKRARRVGTPIIAVTTADQPTAVASIAKGLNGSAPLILWDVVRGLSGLNEKGIAAAQQVIGNNDPTVMTNLVEALSALSKAPQSAGENRGTVTIIANAHRFLDDAAPIQGIMNLRDPYKSTDRTIILLGVDFRLPAELSQDVLILDEPLPSPEAIRAILTGLYDGNGVTTTDEFKSRAEDALRGLAAFPIEQAAALSVRSVEGKPTADLDALWDRKRRMIQQVRGLAIEKPSITFDELGGLEQIKKFTRQIFTKRRPRVIFRLDEIEKMLAGAGTAGGYGDSSGTSQDQLKVFLTMMEKRKYRGFIAVGPPGSGKSAICEAIAAELDVPFGEIDLGEAKGSLVGQSEQQIRAIEKAIYAIAGDGGAFIIGTCNRLDTIPPELRRRFRSGIWFFDLPDAAERQSIGRLQAIAAGIDPEVAAKFFADKDGWSGANIRDCCEIAADMDSSLAEASAYVVPASKADPEGVEQLRTKAHAKFLSASKPGTYERAGGIVEVAEPRIRRITAIAEVEQPESPSKAEKARGN